MSTTRKVLLWVLGMLFLPPLAGFIVAMAGQWSSAGAQFGLTIYTLGMIGMAIGAAVSVATTGMARFGMFFVFLIGMVFLQCAVFFVGCCVAISVQ